MLYVSLCVQDCLKEDRQLRLSTHLRFLLLYQDWRFLNLIQSAQYKIWQVLPYKEKINWLMLSLFGITQATVLQFWTPDFLKNFGNGTPNGALWTICVIVQFYIVCWFVHKFLKGKPLWIWCEVLVGSIAVGWASPLLANILPTIIYKLYGKTKKITKHERRKAKYHPLSARELRNPER